MKTQPFRTDAYTAAWEASAASRGALDEVNRLKGDPDATDGQILQAEIKWAAAKVRAATANATYQNSRVG